MAGTISRVTDLVNNMGWRYVSFRARHELLLRTGLLKSKFPAAPPYKQYVYLDEWRRQSRKFFFDNKSSLKLSSNPTSELKETFDNIRSGRLLLFNSVLTDLGKDYDWVTNPDSGYKYDVQKHWTEIADYSKEAGDIKYVWEKSRFSYLYDIIRYDYHFNQDCAGMVFGDIQSWIKANPVNCGPNYRCSQEISLRVMNWIFALFYYKDSPALTDEVFNQVQYAIYWQMDHVYKNINFSRIAVRNNHAITETLGLYLVGLLFPSLPGGDLWKRNGKKWFEEEIAYQLYEDGTFLQFSMNYHRVVVQLLTWAITLSEKNEERFSDTVYDRAKKSLVFLRTCMADENGWLPNYGGNDGALFFKLSNSHYRDYRTQLQALGAVLGVDPGFAEFCEDVFWYGLQLKKLSYYVPQNGIHAFVTGGYYVIREPETLTFIKCGSYKDRPSQADNLHVDIWYKGENILPDAGSYKYNTDYETMRYFSGTASHNTVMLGNNDQMLKGGHFIWFYWSQCVEASLTENAESYLFRGSVNAFRYVKHGVIHYRTVTKQKGKPVWQIRDEIAGAPIGLKMRQLWHLQLDLKNRLRIIATDAKGDNVISQKQDGWYSSFYGTREKTREYIFESDGNVIDTIIKVETDS